VFTIILPKLDYINNHLMNTIQAHYFGDADNCIGEVLIKGYYYINRRKENYDHDHRSFRLTVNVTYCL